MEIVAYTFKWLELVLRWGHVLFAILWVGNSFLFNYLDNKLNKNKKKMKKDDQKNWANYLKNQMDNRKRREMDERVTSMNHDNLAVRKDEIKVDNENIK